jgi:hypothetical protein
MLSPRLTVKEESAFALAEGVLKLANDLIDAVIPDVIVVGARSPKSLGLALLCRSVSNFTGALILARKPSDGVSDAGPLMLRERASGCRSM